MEHREPLRIAPGDPRRDPAATVPTVPLPRPMPELAWKETETQTGTGTTMDRRRAHRRLVLVAVAVLAGLAGSIYLGSRTIRSAFAWLADQPQYRLPFHDVQLVPPPPDWYRGGTAAFLESVRRRARAPAAIPVLDLKPNQVRLMFLQSPWVENVVRVTYPPHGLRVDVQYREPAAMVKLPGEPPYLLDASATILPWDDIDPDRLNQGGPIAVIQGDGLSGPLDPRPGATWRPKPGMTDIAEGNGRVHAAAKLAGFLMAKQRLTDTTHAPTPAPAPALAIRAINPMDPQGRGLFLLNGEDSFILWGEAPGEERPGGLNAEEKWAAIRHWGETTPNRRLQKPRDFWRITRSGLVPVDTKVPGSGSSRDPGPE